MGILTYMGKQFYLDGKPYAVYSGAIHYFRVPRAYWRDRLLKLKECGFNTVETYTCWNLHEREEGKFDFTGGLDLAAFVDTAAELGLNVILRPGPYICAEWEFGGFPAWLLKYKELRLRCYDPLYLEKLERYLRALFDQVRSRLAVHGGPVFMLQIENEYGSFGNDKLYLNALKEIYERLGMDCLYFTSDGPAPSMLNGGTVEGVLSVANFGSKPRNCLGVLSEHFPDQPQMCGEYWCGWFDHWGEAGHERPVEEIEEDVKEFLAMGASFNFYMFHGGTNFGFTNGANFDEKNGVLQPTVTSYDYGAPLSEAGDRTELYYRLREIMGQHVVLPALTAEETPKAAYGKLRLTESAELFSQLERISSPVESREPLYMEELGQDFGYLLYRAEIRGPANDWSLRIDEVKDRVQIFADGKWQETRERHAPKPDAPRFRRALEKGESYRLDLLVENMGRINYGAGICDPKGVKGVRFGGQHHFGWQIFPLPMGDELSALAFSPLERARCDTPVFVRGSLRIDGTPKDTFLRLTGFTKGFVKINGVNIGRYFNPAGPQKTLYVPAPFLKEGDNEILVFESDRMISPEVDFLQTPILK